MAEIALKAMPRLDFWVPAAALVRQLGLLSVYRLRSRIRGSVLGLMWVVFHPFHLLALKFLVFGSLMNSRNFEYFLYLSAGYLPWFFLSQSLVMTLRSFERYRALTRSDPGAVVLLLASEILTNFLILFLCMAPLMVFLKPSDLAVLPVIGFNLLALAVAASLLMAMLQTFFRDIQFILPLVLQTMLFLSPVLYAPGQVPINPALSRLLNPLYLCIEPFQLVWSGGRVPLDLVAGNLLFTGTAVAATLATWRRFRNAVVMYV